MYCDNPFYCLHKKDSKCKLAEMRKDYRFHCPYLRYGRLA